jgi:hypothetical protein
MLPCWQLPAAEAGACGREANQHSFLPAPHGSRHPPGMLAMTHCPPGPGQVGWAGVCRGLLLGASLWGCAALGSLGWWRWLHCKGALKRH